MRVLMLGWELPPFFAGGVGVVCEALTRALAARGTSIDYLIPAGPEPGTVEHMRLLDVGRLASTATSPGSCAPVRAGTPGLNAIPVGAHLAPYAGLEGDPRSAAGWDASTGSAKNWQPRGDSDSYRAPDSGAFDGPLYGPNLLEQIQAFAVGAVAALDMIAGDIDVIHAHDWTTVPAAIALKERLCVPLCVHVHITEQDKAGGGPGDGRVVEIERQGMLAADQVIAVSHRVRDQIIREYSVAPEKVSVVHNAVDFGTPDTGERLRLAGPMVLFLGRVTLQKGPDYFLRAARRVLDIRPDVTFVLAGSGDMLPQMIELAADLGIGHRVLFAGFVERGRLAGLYASADLFVMPSVSEPFGIVPLEAISHGTPVILSRQSGASEVLHHVLKVDFWNTEILAAQILAMLTHAVLRSELRTNSRREVRRLTWDRAAAQIEDLYRHVVGQASVPMPGPAS